MSKLATVAAAAFVGGLLLHKLLTRKKAHPLDAVRADLAEPKAVTRSADGHSAAELGRLLAVIEKDIVPLTSKGECARALLSRRARSRTDTVCWPARVGVC
jgi:hypothetical protein